uniref:uncharacterized protein LOC114677758 n=1 Tax=Macaca mulatta TaxID=9544 RepID=UPI0010A24014|nr:uncharacterized protein LOC114677758 [Macaca mulatta]
MTCALPALAFQGSTLILNRFWGFMCRFLTWVYCVMLRFGVQLISSPRELCRADPQDSSSRPDTFILHLLPWSNQARKPAHYPEEPAQEASPLSRGTSPGSQPTIQRNQPRKPAHCPEEAAQEASPPSGGSSPGSQPIVRRKPALQEARKPAHARKQPRKQPSPSCQILALQAFPGSRPQCQLHLSKLLREEVKFHGLISHRPCP